MDLWKKLNLDTTGNDEVTAFLRQQANLLERKTSSVLRVKLKNLNLGNQQDGYCIATNFNVVAPVLDHYSHTLFTVYSNPGQPYPVAIDGVDQLSSSGQGFDYVCHNKTEFIKALSEILSKDEVLNTVASIYSKSRQFG